MRARLLLAAMGVVGLGLTATPAMAHHSFAAEFDANTPVALTGTIKWGLRWVWGRISLVSMRTNVLVTNTYLQLKLILIALAGVNALLFYVTGVGREVDALGPGDDASTRAKAMAAASLVLWTGVMYFGRLIPWGL